MDELAKSHIVKGVLQYPLSPIYADRTWED